MATILMSLLKNKNIVIRAVCGLSMAFLIAYGVILHRLNKNLTDGLETALNNIEAYQGVIDDKQEQNNILKLTVLELNLSNDRLLLQLDSAIDANKIKTKYISTAATQTQTVYVNSSKGVRGDLVNILKDSVYVDSIKYNDLTKVYYTIGKDTVDITIDLKNTLYLLTYKKKEYKNKKKFFLRLITLDFKKVWRYLYKINNTNDLINTSDVRVVEII